MPTLADGTVHDRWRQLAGMQQLVNVIRLWGCSNHAYGLLANWSGTPNSYGQVFYEHFAARAASGS